ncbi:MAG: NAD-dependent succinate-semialdehyde dehydrogenase [Desulfobacterales bacterium]|nr:NAD-dependent succinate-semialdehyde dehydrogenase [Desulfobacterales bacterium]
MITLKDQRLLRFRAFINNAWTDGLTGSCLPVNNPATGETIGTVPDMGAAETRLAIDAANAAWPSWRAKTAKERAKILHHWFCLMMENQEDLALIMTAEQGKPLTESRGEITYAASFIEWFAEEGKRLYGDVIPSHQAETRLVVLKEPVGVCAAITPWNFPSAMITRKAGPALAAGCTMIVKPASQTPLSALALAELGHRAGLPPGVFNVITGASGPIAKELTSNPTVRKLTFTGSTQVGKILMAQCADTIKKISLELGGNAPFIVFEDADPDKAIAGAISCKFRNTGQTCVCANRFLIQDSIYDRFAENLTQAVSAFRVGPGDDPEVFQGPLINMNAVEKVEDHLADALAKGAKLMTGGQRHKLGGTFFEPTVITEANSSMKIAREETFGPVAALFRFNTEAQAIAMANDTQFGLAAYVYTGDLGRTWRMAEALEYGMVGVNTGIISTEIAPFGGVKQSGIGREGSKYGIEEFIEVKYVCMALPDTGI